MNIRAITLQDAIAFHHLVKNNYDHLKDYFPVTVSACESEKTATELVEGYLQKASKNGMYVFVGEDEISKQLLSVLIVKEIVVQHSKCEIAYFVDKEQQGKGLATKGVRYLITFIFETIHLNKICCKIATDNYSSNKVAINNGFQLEGVLKKEFKISTGKFIDINCYGLLRKISN